MSQPCDVCAFAAPRLGLASGCRWHVVLSRACVTRVHRQMRSCVGVCRVGVVMVLYGAGLRAVGARGGLRCGAFGVGGTDVVLAISVEPTIGLPCLSGALLVNHGSTRSAWTASVR